MRERIVRCETSRITTRYRVSEAALLVRLRDLGFSTKGPLTAVSTNRRGDCDGSVWRALSEKLTRERLTSPCTPDLPLVASLGYTPTIRPRETLFASQ
jgi:hypothetical protein